MDVLLVCHFKFWTSILLHEQSPVHLGTHWRIHRLYPVFDSYRLTWYTFLKKFFEYAFFLLSFIGSCGLSCMFPGSGFALKELKIRHIQICERSEVIVFGAMAHIKAHYTVKTDSWPHK